MLPALPGRLARRCGQLCRQQALLFEGEVLRHVTAEYVVL